MKLDSQSPTVLQIKGNVVEASLELLHLDTEEPLDCVTFGATYYGTDRTEAAILFNNGPEPACFVAVLDEDAPGQEIVSIATIVCLLLVFVYRQISQGREDLLDGQGGLLCL